MRVNDRYWIVRHPQSQGAVIAKMDASGGSKVPDEIADYDDFVVQSVPDQSALIDADVDHSGLSDEELNRISLIYPTDHS